VSEVIDVPEQGRFELDVDGHIAELYYRVEGSRLVLIHTEVPDALGGKGIGGLLVRAAVDRAASDGLTIVPRCPFARGWLERHPDEVGTVAIDWELGR
jgi:predicted GNAT family acetyltransferase